MNIKHTKEKPHKIEQKNEKTKKKTILYIIQKKRRKYLNNSGITQ